MGVWCRFFMSFFTCKDGDCKSFSVWMHRLHIEPLTPAVTTMRGLSFQPKIWLHCAKKKVPTVRKHEF